MNRVTYHSSASRAIGATRTQGGNIHILQNNAHSNSFFVNSFLYIRPTRVYYSVKKPSFCRPRTDRPSSSAYSCCACAILNADKDTEVVWRISTRSLSYIVHVDVASAAAVTIGPRVTATVIVLDVLRYMHSLGSPRTMWTGSGS